jgi:hypothetical protein
MTNYRYNLIEGWSKLDSSPLSEPVESQHWDDYLQANGYYTSGDRIGHDCGWEVIVRGVDKRMKIQPQFPYVVEIGNSSESELVFCDDFLSAADLVSKFAPLATAQVITSVFDCCLSLVIEFAFHSASVFRALSHRPEPIKVL